MIKASNGSTHSIKWFHIVPLANVKAAWSNSMGFLNEIQVQGQLIMTLNGQASWKHHSNADVTFNSQLNPTYDLLLLNYSFAGY